MKWLLLAIVLVYAVWIWSLDQATQTTSNAGASGADSANHKYLEREDFDDPILVRDSIDVPDSSQKVEIGVPLDPSDRSDVTRQGARELIEIGQPMDPDDPSTWPARASYDVVEIGQPMDPDDSSTWPVRASYEVIKIGEPMNPDGDSSGPERASRELVEIGEPMAPEDGL